jgi:uncharacterized OB-fold protein
VGAIGALVGLERFRSRHLNERRMAPLDERREDVPNDEPPRTRCPACGAAITSAHARCPDCDIALQ